MSFVVTSFIRPPAVAGIDEGVQPDPGDQTRPVRCRLPEQVRDDALRQAVRLHLVLQRQPAQRRHQTPVPADDPGDQALVGQVVQPLLPSVALPRGVDQGEPSRRPGLHEATLERRGERLGEPDSHESARGHGVPVQHDPRRRVRSDDLVPSHLSPPAAPDPVIGEDISTVADRIFADHGGHGGTLGIGPAGRPSSRQGSRRGRIRSTRGRGTGCAGAARGCRRLAVARRDYGRHARRCPAGARCCPGR